MTEELNPTKLTRSQFLMLINGTPQEEVIKQSRLMAYEGEGGVRFKHDKQLDIIRFIAWAADRKRTYKKKGRKTYGQHQQEMRDRSAERSLAGREIGKIPKVKNPERREACRLDFELFLTTYFPEIFCLPFSPNHRLAITSFEDTCLKGGLFALAMPRGTGKTSIAECADIWTVCYAHRKFSALIGSDAGHAADMLASIKSSFEHNELLLEDFPEICFPIRAIGGNAQRTGGQLCEGKRTEITWKNNEIIFPTIKGSKSSGSIIKTGGIRRYPWNEV